MIKAQTDKKLILDQASVLINETDGSNTAVANIHKYTFLFLLNNGVINPIDKVYNYDGTRVTLDIDLTKLFKITPKSGYTVNIAWGDYFKTLSQSDKPNIERAVAEDITRLYSLKSSLDDLCSSMNSVKIQNPKVKQEPLLKDLPQLIHVKLELEQTGPQQLYTKIKQEPPQGGKKKTHLKNKSKK